VSTEEEEFREFLDIFQEESLERLLNVSRSLEAVQGGEPPFAHLDEVDRELHTIKGSARLLGFPLLAHLVHELEGLARSYRERSNQPQLDLLVEASDVLSALVEAASIKGKDVTDELLLERVVGSIASMAGVEGPSASPLSSPRPTFPKAPLDAEVDQTLPVGSPVSLTPASPPGKPGSGLLPPPSTSTETMAMPARRIAKPEAGAADTSSTRTRGDARRAEDEMVRVRASRLAELDEIVSDLTLARQRLDTYEARLQTLLKAVHEGSADAGDVTSSLGRVVRDFRGDILQVRNATTSLQHLAVDVRLRPVAHLFDRVPRQVRELSRQLDKRVRVSLQGEETEMDRVILDSLKSPLTHLLRNALDHGFETESERVALGKPPEGLLELSAGQEGNRIAIHVTDDGRGIDPQRVLAAAVERGILDANQASQTSDEDAIQLIFSPGFSTKDGVTEISGRGVGISAMRSVVEQLKGDLLVSSQLGVGSRFSIRLPLTLLISRVMLVRSAGQRFALPTEAIDESVRLLGKDVASFNGRSTVVWRDQMIPLLRLASFLSQPILPDAKYLRALVVRHGTERVALAVEEILEERSVVVKPLGWPLELLPWVSGAVQDPSGEIALQIHVPALFARMRSGAPTEPTATASKARTVLVVDDSIVSRQRLGRALEELGFDPIVAVDGVDAWSLLERVRPLLVLTDIEMPRLDGLGLTRRIRANPQLAEVPIVIVSNRGAPQDREAGLQAGADAYLPKSEFTSAGLRELVERLL
jgi:two-component system chemotaxis sensor kinase CheA